jgi:flavin reductase (DIM6/NTAB) family NADH-FMN oxidoreductase RutF
MAKRPLSLSKVYTLLESGAVIMVTTAYKGKSNIMTMSWHTMMDFEPPFVGFVMSDRNYSFGLLRKSRECGINIPTVEIAEKAVACGRIHGGKINKFEKFGLTPGISSIIGVPLIEECYAGFECRVADTKMVNKYGFFVVEVVKAWIDKTIKNPQTLHHLGGNNFMVAGKRIQIKSPK